MFVHDFAQVSLPCEVLADTMSTRGPELLNASVSQALTGGVGPVPFDLNIGALVSSPQASVLPFALQLDSRQIGFHRLQGDLEFFELDPACCQLRLLGTYGRPERSPSRVDHARVETTVRAVLTHLARSLEDDAALRRCHG